MSSKPLSNFLKTSEGGTVLGAVSDLYEFGEFRLDAQSRVLLHGLRPVPLSLKASEMLLVLVQSSGQIVTKDALMKAVWPDRFVGESNLTQTIFMLRKALGETREQRYILTIPGTGYRFTAPVKRISGGGDTAVETPPAAGRRPQLVPMTKSRSRLRPVAIGIAVLLSAALGGYFQWLRSGPKAQPAGGRLMLAVLPFDNLTGEGQDYFSDGLTDEMITRLGSLDPQHLGVIARTSVMHYKNSQEKLSQIGRELGVQYVLEGSVRRDSEKVRITAQLIQVKDQTHLWAHQYDRELNNLLSLQSEITHEVSDEIRVALGDHKPTEMAFEPPSSRNYEAYDLYLKGQYFWNKRTTEGFRRAIDYFQQAINKDPNYARAYAGLADSYALIGGYSLAPQAEFIPKARAAALRAVEIDDRLAEAHTALGLIVQNYDWDWQTADKEFRRAIELNPNYATGHHWYAEHLAWMGRFDEALRESERARQLDPLSLIIATDNGAILYYSRQYDRAIEQFRAVRELDPNFSGTGMIRQAYAQKGMFAEVSAELEKARKTYGDAPWICSGLARVYGRTGQQAQARHEMAKLEQWNRRQPIDPAVFFSAYVGMGNKDQALAWLEKAYTQHSNAMITLKVDPLYDPLRDDPRFQNFLRRVGLAE